MPLAVSHAATSRPLFQAQTRYSRDSNTTGLASSGVLVVAWTPAFGNRHTTPPRSAVGHRPASSTALKRMAKQCQTETGHCLIRRTCQPS